MEGIATRIGGVGMVQAFVRRGMKAGRKTKKVEEKLLKKDVEELVKNVPMVYSAHGKIIKYDDHCRRLDVYC